MGGSDFPLLQLSFDPRLRRGSRAVIYLLKKGQALCAGQGRRAILVEVALVIVKYCMAFRHAFCCSKVLLRYILSFYLCPCFLTKVNTSIKTLGTSCAKLSLEQGHLGVNAKLTASIHSHF